MKGFGFEEFRVWRVQCLRRSKVQCLRCSKVQGCAFKSSRLRVQKFKAARSRL